MPSILDLAPEKRFEILVGNVVDYAIYLLDLEGKIVSWNTGAQRIKGYSPDEIIGQHFSLFYTPEDRQRLVPYDSLRTAREKGKFEAEGWRQRKDGTRFWASVVIDAVRSETGELIGYAKITRDVTDRRNAELQLLDAREQLLQAQKMESIGQLTGGIAHDFNNLLTVILSGINMIDRLGQGNDRLLSILGNMRHAVQRGEKLTRHLLTYSRRQALKPELIDLSLALQSFFEGMLQTLKGNVEVETDVPPDLWDVEVDAAELDLALINIALNARDAMVKGGTLRVRARNEPRGASDLQGARVSISISDTGIGMSPDTVSRATEPFFTTKPPGAGTGLGLSQAFGFARQSGGALTIDSAIGRGTTVTVTLPAAQSADVSLLESGASKGLTVLVVEDEALVAEMARSILAEAGYGVEVAHTAARGLEIVRRSKIDAVFSDIVMPGNMNGIDLAIAIGNEFPDVPVLLTSGFHQLPANHTARHQVLRKPYDETQLLTALGLMLGDAKTGAPA
jgi:PAS domain S-box-containing protein